MGIYDDKFKKYGFVPLDHAQPNYFDVGMCNVFDDKGTKINGHMAVKRMDTYDTLAVHSDAYRPVLDRDVFQAFEAGLHNSKLDTTGLAVMHDRSHNGARMFVQYVLPAVTRNINGADISLRFLMWNSHDGSRRASGRAGFFSWVCANESVVGHDLDAFAITHKGAKGGDNITSSRALVSSKIDGLIKGASGAIETLERMQRWTSFKITDAQFEEVVLAIPGSTEGLCNSLVAEWVKVKRGTGPNSGDTLWAAYNVLTNWATHTEGRTTKNSVNAKVERQERVAKTMQRNEWQQLEYAAA